MFIYSGACDHNNSGHPAGPHIIPRCGSLYGNYILGTGGTDFWPSEELARGKCDLLDLVLGGIRIKLWHFKRDQVGWGHTAAAENRRF